MIPTEPGTQLQFECVPRLEFHIGDRLLATSGMRSAASFSTIHEEVLLATLLLARPRELSRIALATALWPSSAKNLALQSLRQRLSSLNTKFPELIEADRTTLRLAREVLVVVNEVPAESPVGDVLARARQIIKQCEMLEYAGQRSTGLQRILEASGDGKIFSSTPCRLSAHRALDPDLPLTERLTLGVELLANPSQMAGKNQALSLAKDLAFAQNEDPALAQCQWFACQAGSALAHQAGQWSNAYHFQRRALEIATHSKDAKRSQWSQFRRTRIDIDMGINARNVQALSDLSQSPGLNPKLRALTQVNLVFAYAAVGQSEATQSATDFCRKSPLVNADWEFCSWLSLNEAMSWILLRSPQKGIDSLLRAAQLADGKIGALEGVWHWMVAAQLFGAMGETALTAELSAMVDLGIRTSGWHVSPVNARIYHSILGQATRRSSPAEWLDASEHVGGMPRTELHSHYVAQLRQAAARLV